MTAVQVIQDQLGRLVGLLGSPNAIDAYLSHNGDAAEAVAAGIFADADALAAFELGESDLPASVAAALDVLIAHRNAYNPLSKTAA